jgi:hypothetical protein
MNEYLLFGGGALGIAWMIRMHVKRAFSETAEETER